MTSFVLEYVCKHHKWRSNDILKTDKYFCGNISWHLTTLDVAKSQNINSAHCYAHVACDKDNTAVEIFKFDIIVCIVFSLQAIFRVIIYLTLLNTSSSISKMFELTQIFLGYLLSF